MTCKILAYYFVTETNYSGTPKVRSTLEFVFVLFEFMRNSAQGMTGLFDKCNNIFII